MKTSLSPTWIPGLGFALILAWTSAGLAQNEPGRPATFSSAASVSQPAAPRSPATAAATSSKAMTAPALRISSPGLLPLNLFPAAGTWSANAVDRDGLPANSRFSYWTTEVIKLARAGIDEDVLLPFIDSVGRFDLSADEIIYLSDLGVSSRVMTTMIQHDFEVAAGLRLVTASASPSSMLFLFDSSSESKTSPNTQPVNPPSSTAAAHSSGPAGASAATTGGSSVPAAKDAVLADRGDIGSDLAAFDLPKYDQAPLAAAPAPNQSRPVPARTATLYVVRQPYAEAVTPPIIIVPGVDRTPNVVLIRFDQ